jgi:hypothetical protein
MLRQTFLAAGAAAFGETAVQPHRGQDSGNLLPGPPPAWAVVPVVGDGRWINVEPPADGSGYFDERPFALAVGIEIRGRGNAADMRAAIRGPGDQHPWDLARRCWTWVREAWWPREAGGG